GHAPAAALPTGPGQGPGVLPGRAELRLAHVLAGQDRAVAVVRQELVLHRVLIPPRTGDGAGARGDRTRSAAERPPVGASPSGPAAPTTRLGLDVEPAAHLA